MSTSAERAREFVEAGFRDIGVPSLEPYIEIVAELLEHERALAVSECAACIPTTWLDPLLSGPNKAAEFTACNQVEKILTAVRNRITALATAKQGGEK